MGQAKPEPGKGLISGAIVGEVINKRSSGRKSYAKPSKPRTGRFNADAPRPVFHALKSPIKPPIQKE